MNTDNSYINTLLAEAEARANARLIAAAPELMSDLEDLVLSCSKVLPYEHPALINARATIAKAKGGV